MERVYQVRDWGVCVSSPHRAPEKRCAVVMGYCPELVAAKREANAAAQAALRIESGYVAEVLGGRRCRTLGGAVYELVGPPHPDWLAAITGPEQWGKELSGKWERLITEPFLLLAEEILKGSPHFQVSEV